MFLILVFLNPFRFLVFSSPSPYSPSSCSQGVGHAARFWDSGEIGILVKCPGIAFKISAKEVAEMDIESGSPRGEPQPELGVWI
jgi:hypothetical protein